MPFEITFILLYVAVVALIAAASAYIDRALKRHIGDEPQPATAWSRRVESLRTRIEAQSLAGFMRGEPPIDKDAELRRRLEVPEQARP